MIISHENETTIKNNLKDKTLTFYWIESTQLANPLGTSLTPQLQNTTIGWNVTVNHFLDTVTSSLKAAS